MRRKNIQTKMNSDSGVSLGHIYRLLAIGMRYPDSAWLNEGFMSNLVALLGEAGFGTESAGLSSLMPPDMESGQSLADKVINALQVEFTRLFINAPAGCPAPPFGSVYLESCGSLQAVTTEKVRLYYRSHGFDIADSSIIPDEISVELEFLGLLVSKGEFDKEGHFLKEFFRPWFVTFRDIVLKEARHPYYPALVRLIDFFTSQEVE